MRRFAIVFALLVASAVTFAQQSTTNATKPAAAKPAPPQYKTVTLINWDRAMLRKAADNNDLPNLMKIDIRRLPEVLNSESAQGWQLVAAIPLTHDFSMLNTQHPTDIRSDQEQVRLVFRKP